MADLTEFQKLEAAVANNPPLRERLTSIVQGEFGNNLDRHAALGDFAREVAASQPATKDPIAFDPSKVVESFAAMQQRVPTPQQNDPFAKREEDQPSAKKHSSGAQHPSPINQHMSNTAISSIHSEQQRRLLEEYEHALVVEDSPEHPTARQDAVNKILNKLDARSLLQDQIALIRDSANGVDPEILKITEERIQKELLKKEKEEHALIEQEKSSLAQKRSQEEHLTQAAQTVTNKEQARAAFTKLLSGRQEETRGYNIFLELGNRDEDALHNLILGAQTQKRELQEITEHTEHKEELRSAQRQASRKQNGITAYNTGMQIHKQRGGGVKGRIMGGLKKQAKKYLIEILFLAPPYIGWWIVGILILILLILILIIAIIAVVSYVTGQSSSGGFGGTPQNVAALVSVVQQIETCERRKYGLYAPYPSCITALNLPATFGREIQGFVNDVNRGYADYQCGQYIWSAQKYILNWPAFPSNVATVYIWYTINANHALVGYNWIPNPDNPAWSNSSSPANILPGDIVLYASTGGGDPGHIAIVTNVQSDSFNFTVSEANYYHGAIDLRPTNLHDGLGRGAYILGWWRRQ